MIISHEIAVYNDDALKKKFSSIQQTSDAITLTVSQKVGYNEIISSINQTAEQIQISASKIDLRGYATFSDLPTKTSQLTNNSGYVNGTQLSTANQTVINGGNITTGIIKDAAGKFSLNMETGAINMADGTFSGSITASSGSVGGFTIESDYLYKGATIGTSGAFWLWPAGSDSFHKASIAGSGNISGWAMTISDKFGVTNGGIVHTASLVSKGTLQVYNSYNKLEMELNQNGMDIYDADDTSSNLLGKIGVNNYVGSARYLAVDMLGSNCSGFNITRRAYGSDEGKNLFQIEKDGTTAIHGDLSVGDSSGTARTITTDGNITAGGYFIGKLKTTNAGGFYTDVYGNFIHQSNVTSDTWNVKDKDENTKFSVEYQSGNTRILGTLAVTGAATVGGAATVTGALAANGGISVPSGKTVSGYFEAPSSDGFTTDAYGNFRHKSTTASNTWGIQKKVGTNWTSVFWVYYQSGNTGIAGDLSVTGATTLTGALAANGGITVPTTAGKTVSALFEAPNEAGFTSDIYGNIQHKRSTNTDTWGIYPKSSTGTPALTVNYETGVTAIKGAASIGGALTINGTLTGSTSESTSRSIYGLTIRLTRNAGTVTLYIGGTTSQALGTSNTYVTLWDLSDSTYKSWLPANQIIDRKVLTAAGLYGQVTITTTEIRLGYVRDLTGANANIPASTGVYQTTTWAAR